VSNPDLPRPNAADGGRDDRAWNGSGNGRAGRAAGRYDPAGQPGGRSGYGRARSAGRGGDGYGGSGWGERGQSRWDDYTGRGDRRGDSGRGGQRDGARPGERDGGRGSWGRGGQRDGARSRTAMRSEPVPRGRDEWGRPGPGGPRGRDGGPGAGTAVRERLAARTGGQYRGDGRLRGLTGRLPFGDGGGPGGRGGRPRRKGDWWRRWTWKKALTVAGIGAGVCMVVGAAGVGIVYAQTTIPNPQASVFQQASTVYFSDGKTMVGQFGSTNRQMLTYNQIPPVMRNAMVAAEDKHFYHEGGISPTGIIRAAYYDLTTSTGAPQGASTLTQQLVRQYYDNIGTQQTISRKIKEIFVAEKLAQVKSKAWILTTYLNTVYFGAGAYGVGAAAQTYFGENVSQLTPSQAAMIAAMPQQPGYYTPNPKGGAAYGALVYRWKYVLGAMLKMGTLSQQQYNQALQHGFPKVIKPVNNNWSGYRGYIMQAVYNELRNTYGFSQNRIDNGGLHIVTTFKHSLMNSLYAAVKSNQALMRAGTPPGGATVPSTGLPKYVDIGAVLENPANGAIEAMYSGPNYNQSQYDYALQARNQVGSSFKPYVLATAVKEGMSVQTSKLNGYSPLWIPPDSSPNTFASLTKPANPGSWYQVVNDEVSNPNRPVSVVEATAMSLNTAYTDLWHRVAYNPATGDHPVVDMAKAFGVNVGPYPNGSGLANIADQAGTALGQASLTVEEQATMIATLADNGLWHTPHVVAKVSWTDPQTGAQVMKNAIIHSHVVLTPPQAADVDYAMSFDTTPNLGTAPGDGLTNGQTVIAKTGTTNLSQQAFFEGATPGQAMAVGMFVNNSACPRGYQAQCSSISSLKYNPNIPGLQTLFGVGGWAGYGGQWPATIWHTFFMNEFNNLPVQPWPPVNSLGTTWNLVSPNLIPKPKPKPQQGGQPGCNGNGRKCKPGPGGGGQPPPTVPPTTPPTTPPTPSCGPPLGPPCPSPKPTG
jgi:membrane peptidoglycan carboxypeptidase